MRARSGPADCLPRIKMDPDGPKGHYSFNFPIQPDDGEKDTMFQISYSLPYSGGKYDFKSLVSLPADNLAVLMPKSMTFVAGRGRPFKAVQEDPGVQTYLLKNAMPGKPVEFTVSGTGSMPREAQTGGGGPQADSGGAGCKRDPATRPAAASARPSTRPIRCRSTSGGFWADLHCCWRPRRPSCCASRMERHRRLQPRMRLSLQIRAAGAPSYAAQAPATKHASLLDALKEELFAIESERISGIISTDEYNQVKGALEIVLKRALKRNS